MKSALTVWWNGAIVGTLRLDEHGDTTFDYAPDWLADPNAPALSRSLPKQAEPFDRRRTRPFFAGLLPEEAQRDAVARALGISKGNDFAFLKALGGDVAGALTLWPEGETPPVYDGAIAREPLGDNALVDLLDTLPTRPFLAGDEGLRLSLAGAQAYTRAVMERAEQALGVRLEWIAVDHWDTDNPHTHIILRGKRPDGRDLVIPREFVSHGFRSAARDAATERPGPRGRDDARRAMERDALVHGPSRLDGMIAGQLDEERRVRLARLQAPDRSPELENALKARAQELKRMGLAVEVERNIFQFEPGWRDALKAMELHLDIRKSLIRARTQDLARKLDQSLKLSRSLRLGPDR